jgi:hypothetical protein
LISSPITPKSYSTFLETGNRDDGGEIAHFREIIGFEYIYGKEKKKGYVSIRQVPMLLSSKIPTTSCREERRFSLSLSISTCTPKYICVSMPVVYFE